MDRKEEALFNRIMGNDIPQKEKQNIQVVNISELDEYIEMIKSLRQKIKEEIGITEEEYIIEYIRMFLFGVGE